MPAVIIHSTSQMEYNPLKTTSQLQLRCSRSYQLSFMYQPNRLNRLNALSSVQQKCAI